MRLSMQLVHLKNIVRNADISHLGAIQEDEKVRDTMQNNFSKDFDKILKDY